MLLQLSESDFTTFLALTIVLVIVKVSLAAFLAKKVIDHERETGKFSFGFIFGVLVMFITLLVSRILYMVFDFVLTLFDENTYYLMPNIWFWKSASAIVAAGYAIMIYITDKRVLQFRFKGIIAYIICGVAVVQLLYPVASKADFDTVSAMSFLVNLVAIVIPAFFFYMAKNPSPFRAAAVMIALGVIVYAIGANITVESLVVMLVDAFGPASRITMYFLSLLFKVAGLLMFSYGVTRFAIKFSK